MAHQISARFDNTSDTNNYIRWYLRDTNGSLQNAMQIRADKGMNIYGNLYLAGLMYGTSAISTGTLTTNGSITTGHGLTIGYGFG